ncbi:Imm1 family immunity protein [Streptomyces sp. NPDC051576]|uniref:Imm1 family immunity protein n=2 Tax=Streptomyces TaxID=1883 RepID=UPI00342BF88B
MRGAVILSAFFNGSWTYGETAEEMGRVILNVMENLRGEDGEGRSYTPGSDAWFSMASERQGNESRAADNHLRVAVNRRTGYGSLIWFVDDGSSKVGDVYGSVWISDNPHPSSVDPRVVSDPGYPLFHDPASAIPLDRVRAALEEFCLSGCGDRPSCIGWVSGEANGQRFDRAPVADIVEDPVIDWDGLS